MPVLPVQIPKEDIPIADLPSTGKKGKKKKKKKKKGGNVTEDTSIGITPELVIIRPCRMEISCSDWSVSVFFCLSIQPVTNVQVHITVRTTY